jgi:hypothetical protein
MTVKPRHRGSHLPEDPRQSEEKLPAQQPVGRPNGEPATIVNVRLPRTLLAQRDRSLDPLEWQTGLNANRGMIARRALALLLASPTSEKAAGREEEDVIWSAITTIVAHNKRREERLSPITETLSPWCPFRRRYKKDSTMLTRA